MVSIRIQWGVRYVIFMCRTTNKHKKHCRNQAKECCKQFLHFIEMGSNDTTLSAAYRVMVYTV